jgi:hypothetical protein
MGGLLTRSVEDDLYEAATNKRLFYVSTQAALTTTVAMATAFTGLLVYNPLLSGKKFSVRAFNWKLTTAQATVTLVTLGGGWDAGGGVTAHTTPAVWGTNMGSAGLGDGTTGCSALCDFAATIVNPRGIIHYGGSFTAGALAPDSGIQWTKGFPVLYPGAYACIFTLTVTSGQGFIAWSEETL